MNQRHTSGKSLCRASGKERRGGNGGSRGRARERGKGEREKGLKRKGDMGCRKKGKWKFVLVL